MITAPAARAPIVDAERRMTSPMQRAMQALCDAANSNVYAGDATGPSFTIGKIGAGRSLIRVNFDLVPAVYGDDLYLIAHTGSGVAVATNSWAWPYNDGAATAAADADTSDTQIILAKMVQNDASTGGVHGEIVISNIQSARHKRVGGWVTHFDGARERAMQVAGRIATALPITGFELKFSTGAIASGLIGVDAP